MSSFVSSGYAVILLVWGVAFELVGFVLVVIIQRAIMRDQALAEREGRSTEQPPQRQEEKDIPATTARARERDRSLVGTKMTGSRHA